jgi:hypothetical protein
MLRRQNYLFSNINMYSEKYFSTLQHFYVRQNIIFYYVILIMYKLLYIICTIIIFKHKQIKYTRNVNMFFCHSLPTIIMYLHNNMYSEG